MYDKGHGLYRPLAVADYLSRTVAWFDNWLRDLRYPDPGRQKVYDAGGDSSQGSSPQSSMKSERFSRSIQPRSDPIFSSRICRCGSSSTESQRGNSDW